VIDDIEPDGIARFVARASGFGVTVLNSTSKTDGSTLVLPVHFEILPPADPLAKYDHRPVHVARDIKAGDIEFFIPGNGSDNPEPRRLLREMERYRPSLVSSTSDRHRKRIDRDATLVALRTAASAVLTVPILVLVWATKLPDHGSIAYRAAEFALATGILVVAEPIYSGSFRSVWYLHEADLGVLTTVSTLVTYIFSAVAFAFQVAGRPFADPFFETLALLITLVFLGRTLQAYTRKAAYIATTQVSTLQPAQATVVNESQGRDPLLETVDARLLHYDDIIRIESGQVVPTDGIIVTGTADLDEATMTGESLPVTRTTGSTAMAGTTVLQGTIDICVTRLTCNNSLSSMVQALSRAQNSTSKYQDFADRMASILLPIASGIAIASCVIWLLVSHYVRDRTWADSAVEGVRYLIAVMAVACPCALALAVSRVNRALC
jgi:Cu2+-exporting ATPase